MPRFPVSLASSGNRCKIWVRLSFFLSHVRFAVMQILEEHRNDERHTEAKRGGAAKPPRGNNDEVLQQRRGRTT